MECIFAAQTRGDLARDVGLIDTSRTPGGRPTTPGAQP